MKEQYVEMFYQYLAADHPTASEVEKQRVKAACGDSIQKLIDKDKAYAKNMLIDGVAPMLCKIFAHMNNWKGGYKTREERINMINACIEEMNHPTIEQEKAQEKIDASNRKKAQNAAAETKRINDALNKKWNFGGTFGIMSMGEYVKTYVVKIVRCKSAAVGAPHNYYRSDNTCIEFKGVALAKYCAETFNIPYEDENNPKK